jgi:hypothetical protein
VEEVLPGKVSAELILVFPNKRILVPIKSYEENMH